MNTQLSTVLLLVALGLLIYYLTQSKNTSEGFGEDENVQQLPEPAPNSLSSQHGLFEPSVVNEVPSGEINENQVSINQFESNDVQQTGADINTAFQNPLPPQARPDVVDINKNNVKKYDTKDFLPKEINDKWFSTDFSQAKANLNDDKLINTDKYVIGINTVGQSLKNASYDIRGTIPNPKFNTGPWNNSTIEPDYNIKSMC